MRGKEEEKCGVGGKGKRCVAVGIGRSKRVKFSMIRLYVDSKEESYRLNYALRLSSALECMQIIAKNNQMQLVSNFEADI